ncbi:hypothetical protein C3Y87_01935 [Carbonactinospora thermoautotrophica]|uniref:cupredoxin domain-containing protein n=1 Tax=Carbonactinospora thermoautotrophica TaxID=1469144 RepID=UPI00226E593D|nr:cupredoxin domain-containing protein [Carbonactinospora thermoautotrophica]MCX9190191.1 hypothetical protein [Carbonactinospora thermoautotrophica]
MRLIRSAARSAARATALVALAALVAACGGSNSAKPGSAAPTPAASAPASPSAPATDAVTYQVTIKDGNVEPKPDVVKVKLGQTVRLTVTSDQHDEIHVHGYDVSAELEPNKPTTVEFKASTPGTFEVETHHSGKLLFRLQVQ